MKKDFWTPLSRIITFFLLVVLIYYLYKERLHFPLVKPYIPLVYKHIPVYTLWSLMRMFAAYILSLLFSYIYAYFAATSRRLEGIMLGILDILQSVPVLGFFPAVVYLFVNLLHGSRLGVELAAIILIFTSQAWNITFSVYESIKTIPEEIDEATRLLGVSGLRRFFQLIVPSSIPRVVYNSMLSWSAGWYFLIACEIIAIGPLNYKLPGLGSLLSAAIEEGNTALALACIATLAGVIFLLYFLLWQPLSIWGEKFRYEAESGAVSFSLTYRFWRWVRRTFLVSLLFSLLTSLLNLLMRIRIRKREFPPAFSHFLSLGFYTIFLFLIFFGFVVGIISLFSSLASLEWSLFARIPLAVVASGGKVVAAYLLSLLWTLPVGVFLASHPSREKVFLPFFQMLASIPATAFFPFMVRYIVSITGNTTLSAILLILTGAQWYLLFNIIAGVKAIPQEIRQITTLLGLRGWRYWRKVLIPAIFPPLVTGSITAWGGAWNALIVAEWVAYKGKTFTSFGIGYLLDYAVYKEGNLPLIIASLVAMSLTIIAVNKYFWRPMYNLAAERFRFG